MTRRSLPLRGWAVSIALFAGILICGSLPWPGLRESFNTAFRAGGNALLVGFTFGKGGHASLDPLDAGKKAGGKTAEKKAGPPVREHVAADTVLSLRVDGRSGTLGLGINLHKDVYLPLLLLLSIVLAAPMRPKAKLRCVSVGTPIVLLLGFATIWCLVVYTFAFNVRGVLELGALGGFVTDLVYRGLLLPPGNRFIAPLALGLGLVAFDSICFPGGAYQSPPIPTPAGRPTRAESARERARP